MRRLLRYRHLFRARRVALQRDIILWNNFVDAAMDRRAHELEVVEGFRA